MTTPQLAEPVRHAIAPLHASLREHRVYGLVSSTSALSVFMAHHVFAVWDFMSLLKRLQRDLTCVELPWLPGHDATAARLINDIVLAEESDVVDGTATSHFDLYMKAMADVGASSDIAAFLDVVRARGVDDALATIALTACRAFVTETLRVARTGRTHEVAAAFLLGREDVIPAMFTRLLPSLPTSPAPTALIAYLERHIVLDGDDHGPRAVVLLNRLCGDDDALHHEAAAAAVAACEARLTLWNAIADAIEASAAVARVPALATDQNNAAGQHAKRVGGERLTVSGSGA